MARGRVEEVRLQWLPEDVRKGDAGLECVVEVKGCRMRGVEAVNWRVGDKETCVGGWTGGIETS